MKRKYEINKKQRVVVCYTPTHLKKSLLYTFNYSKYIDTIFLCSEKGYTYQKELNKILYTDSRYILLKLQELGLIEEFVLDDYRLNKLKLLKSLSDNNIRLLTTYKLTNGTKLILQNPFFYELLKENSNLNLKQYVEDLKIEYNNKVQEIENNKDDEEKRFMSRYKIAKIKNINFRSAEDLAIIQMVESVSK